MGNKLTGVRLVATLALVGAAVGGTACSDDEPLINAGSAGSGTGKGGTGGSTAGSGGSTAGSGGAAAGNGGASAGTGGASGNAGASGKGGASGAGAGGASGAGAGGAAGKAGAAGASGAGAGGASGAGAGGAAGAGGSAPGLIDPAKTKTITSTAVTIFDAVPSKDGTTIYFTGLLEDGTGAIFSGPAAGGAGTRLGTASFVVPSGIALSSDGNTLYVADVSDVTEGVADKGRVYSVTTAGAATALAGLDGFGVRGLAIRAGATPADDTLLVSASDPTTGKAGIYKATATGASPTLVTDAIREPSGLVAVGDITYAIDGAGALLTIALAGTTTSTPLPGPVGFPAGVAPANDGTLYVSSATTSNLFTFDIAAKTFTTTSVPLAVGTEGGGFHKAGSAAVFSLVDGTAAGTGAVYVLTPLSR